MHIQIILLLSLLILQPVLGMNDNTIGKQNGLEIEKVDERNQENGKCKRGCTLAAKFIILHPVGILGTIATGSYYMSQSQPWFMWLPITQFLVRTGRFMSPNLCCFKSMNNTARKLNLTYPTTDRENNDSIEIEQNEEKMTECTKGWAYLLMSDWSLLIVSLLTSYFLFDDNGLIAFLLLLQGIAYVIRTKCSDSGCGAWLNKCARDACVNDQYTKPENENKAPKNKNKEIYVPITTLTTNLLNV